MIDTTGIISPHEVRYGQADLVGNPRPRPPVAKRLDAQGRMQPVRNATPTEADRRDRHIVRLFRAGHSAVDIGIALDMSREYVSGRIKALGVSRGAAGKGRAGIGPVTEPCLWRDVDIPVPPMPPRWESSSIVRMADMMNAEFIETSFANVFANEVTEATAAGAAVWLRDTTKLIGAVLDKIERAQRILNDPAYRAECIGHEGFENLRARGESPRLRAVR